MNATSQSLYRYIVERRKALGTPLSQTHNDPHVTDMNRWTQLVTTAEDFERVDHTVIELVDFLLTCHPVGKLAVQPEGPALGSGYLGHALIFAYTAERYGQLKLRDATNTVVESALAEIPFNLHRIGLYGSVAAFGWLCSHLERNFPWFEPVSLDDLDSELHDFVLGQKWPFNYDLITGLVGIGVYALERERASGDALAQLIINKLADTAEVDSDGARWHTPPSQLAPMIRKSAPLGEYNLGLAHGIPGIIGFLARAVGSGIGGDSAIELLRLSNRWLLKNRLGVEHASSFTSRLWEGEPASTSRAAWCYGDPGILVQLLYSAHVLNDRLLFDISEDIVSKLVSRTNVQDQVIDAALCHGSSGLMHIANRVFQYTGELRDKNFASLWLQDTLRRRTPGEGVAGFTYHTPSLPPGYPYPRRSELQRGFLEGIVGIGLSLFATIDRRVPAWDRALLVDLPEKGPPEFC